MTFVPSRVEHVTVAVHRISDQSEIPSHYNVLRHLLFLIIIIKMKAHRFVETTQDTDQYNLIFDRF